MCLALAPSFLYAQDDDVYDDTEEMVDEEPSSKGKKKNWRERFGSVTGTIMTDVQYYFKDTLINAFYPPERVRLNALAQVNYSFRGFTAGARIEEFRNPLGGFPARYQGWGVPYRHISYNHKYVGITVGSTLR